jgi:hypothetical protein
LHVAIVEENELSNRSDQALGHSLSVLAKLAYPANKVGLGPLVGLGHVVGSGSVVGLVPLGSAISCAPYDSIVPQTDIAYLPEIILDLPTEVKDLGEVLALLL